MRDSNLDNKLANSGSLFSIAVFGAGCLVLFLAILVTESLAGLLFLAAIGIAGVLYGRFRFLEGRRIDPSKHIYVIHLNSKDLNNREWAYYPPGEHPFIPFNGLSWLVEEFVYQWQEVTQEIPLFKEGKATVTFRWRPDLQNLQRWMESDQSEQIEYLKKSCAEFAIRRYESVNHAFNKAGRESLIGVPVPLTLDDFYLNRGLEVSGYTITITKLPEPQPAPEPHEPWEGYEELHIGNRGDRAVFLDDEDRVTHVQIIGASRFGKSKLIEYAVRQLIGRQGVIVIDPNEQLYTDLMTWGAHRRQPFVLLDPSDEESEIGFNPFSLAGEKTPARITARASRLLKTALRAGKFQGGEAVLAERIMRVLFYVLIEQDLPVTALQAFMTPRLFADRDRIMAQCASQDIRDEWAMLTKGKGDNACVSMMQSSATRLVNLFTEPGVRRILTNRMQLDIPAIADRGVPVLVNLKDTPDVVSAEARNAIGAFLIDEVWSAIKGRSKEQAQRLPGMNLVIDEFHNFATPEFAMMLKEGGKYGLHMWLVNHALDDLDRDVQNALRACHTRIAFGGTSKKDVASVLEGSKPGQDRSLRDEIERVPGLGKRQFILSRTGKRNEGCATPEVRTFPVPPQRLREYVETITRTSKKETRLQEDAKPEVVAESQAVVQNDSQESAKQPETSTPPLIELDSDDFYH